MQGPAPASLWLSSALPGYGGAKSLGLQAPLIRQPSWPAPGPLLPMRPGSHWGSGERGVAVLPPEWVTCLVICITSQKTPLPQGSGFFSFNYLLARPLYVPSAVLTTKYSPASMKSGTLTTKPVSIVAGFPEPETVAPLIEGWVSVTWRTTVDGS